MGVAIVTGLEAARPVLSVHFKGKQLTARARRVPTPCRLSVEKVSISSQVRFLQGACRFESAVEPVSGT
jgi:hypothetical protein